MLQTDKLPSDFEPYESFAQALAETIKTHLNLGKRICVVAGVDMAHIGKQFGDEFDLTSDVMKEIENRDSVYLSSIVNNDKDLMFRHILEDQDKRRICGFPTMYTVLDVFGRLDIKYTADIFDYRQAVDYNSQCAVTFAGVGMYRLA